jgi:hypothetical protein
MLDLLGVLWHLLLQMLQRLVLRRRCTLRTSLVCRHKTTNPDESYTNNCTMAHSVNELTA